MHQLWSTVLAPVLDALRPASILDVGRDDAHVATLCARHAQRWEGKVLSLQPFSGESFEANLRIEAIGESSALREHMDVDLALIHGDANWWSVHWTLTALPSVPRRTGGPLPITLVHNAGPPHGRRDHYADPASIPANALHPHGVRAGGWQALEEGTPRNGVLTAVEDFVSSCEGLQMVFVPGLGGTVVVGELENLDPHMTELLEGFRLSRFAREQIDSVEDDRLAQVHRAHRAETRAAVAGDQVADREMLHAELGELRARVRELSEALAVKRVSSPDGSSRPAGAGSRGPNQNGSSSSLPVNEKLAEPAPEPTQESVRELLRPPELLSELDWPGSERELSLPIPHDTRRVVDPSAEQRMTVLARSDPHGVRLTLCSILERVEGSVALSVQIDDGACDEIVEMGRRVAHAVAGVSVIRGGQEQPDTHVLVEGEELPRGLRRAGPQRGAIPAVAYLLPGLPPEGSGGSHSLVQEARGLRELGCQARICVPHEALEVASAIYGNSDDLFVAHGKGEEEILEAVGDAAVAVATEHPSLATLQQIRQARPQLVCAYYVQDYEPLFAPPGSARSDRALLSYRSLPRLLLFAKTHWLCNVVAALHGAPIAKVSPSLDRGLFHAEGREERDGVVRVAAMVRPRTPRRRPSATLRTLAAIEAALGPDVQMITFGCDMAAYSQVSAGGADHVEHQGLLSREQVAELMRSSDVFLDASAYQAFGRTGLEAMACGAVPVLPALGGVLEYAEHERNALIFEDDRPRVVADAVIELARHPARLRRLREEGLLRAQGFSVEQAAQSQLELFSAAASRGVEGATTLTQSRGGAIS
jgi:hypothetical protein